MKYQNYALYTMYTRHSYVGRFSYANMPAKRIPCWICIYCQTSNISCTLVGSEIVDHSDVVGASPFRTTSSFSTSHLASMDWAKAAARWGDTFKFLCLILEIWLTDIEAKWHHRSWVGNGPYYSLFDAKPWHELMVTLHVNWTLINFSEIGIKK